MRAERRLTNEVAMFLRHTRHSGQSSRARIEQLSSARSAAAERTASLAARWGDTAADLIRELLARDQELAATTDELRQQLAALSHACALLERERCKYVDLFAHAPDACVVTDLAGVTQDANFAAEALLNVDAGFLVGRHLIGFVARQDTRPFRTLLRELAQDEDGPARTASVRMRPRGRSVFVATARVGAVRAESGKRIAMRWVLQRADDASTLAQRRLADADLARTLNQELRGPLAPLLEWARILRAGQVRDERERDQALAWIERCAAVQQRMLDDLAELADVSGEREARATELVDLGDRVHGVLAALPAAADRTRLRIESETPRAVAVVRAEPRRLDRALRLLLDRAVEGTPPGEGHLRVRVSTASCRADVEIDASAGACRPPSWEVRMAIAARILERSGGRLVLSDFTPSARVSLPRAAL
jgi:PAS domain S-box-containing protein